MSDVYGRKFGLCFSGVACTPWKENRTPEEVRGSSLPWDGMQTWLGGPCCLQPSLEVRIFPVGKVCSKHVGVCFHIFSALNKIYLSLECKAFYEGRSSLILLNDLAEVNAVTLFFAACFSGDLSLFNTYQFLGIFSHWAFCSSCTNVISNSLWPSFTLKSQPSYPQEHPCQYSLESVKIKYSGCCWLAKGIYLHFLALFLTAFLGFLFIFSQT